jgi:hypothetical protein
MEERYGEKNYYFMFHHKNKFYVQTRANFRFYVIRLGYNKNKCYLPLTCFIIAFDTSSQCCLWVKNEY